MRRATAGLLFLVSLWIVPASATAPADAVVEGNTAFAFDLYGRLRAGGGNLFLSPFSISTALAMAYAGARGETGRQMAAVLHFPPGQRATHQGFKALQSVLDQSQSAGATLSVANSLWPQQGEPLLAPFVEAVRDHYGVSVTPLDYKNAAGAARDTINGWVEKETHEKIRDIVAPGVLNALTRLVLVNAIYFKGNWLFPFNTLASYDAPFHLAPGRDATVRMMSQKHEFPYADLGDAQLVEMPYDGDRLAMLLIVPNALDGLPSLEEGLSADRLHAWRARLASREIVVQLPRFTMTTEFRLDQPLAALGMTDAFSESEADFSGMDGRRHWLYIGAVLHKAFVEVNEKGTEAAAATAVIMQARAMPRPLPVVRADHPFLFLIVDRTTGAVLFIGRVADPTAAQG